MITARAILIVVVAGALMLLVLFWLNMDTLEKRHYLAEHIQDLKRQVQQDPTNVQALDEITAALNGNWAFARTYAAVTLGQLGPLARRATPDLIRSLDSGDDFVEREAARALGEVAVGMPEAVEPLRKKVRQFKNDAAWFAAESLGSIGEPALVAIPDLEEAAKSPVPNMSHLAQRGLAKLRNIQQSPMSGRPSRN
jgi:HEAT repeat protein